MMKTTTIACVVLALALSACSGSRTQSSGTSVPSSTYGTASSSFNEDAVILAMVRQDWDAVYEMTIGPSQRGDAVALEVLGLAINDGSVTASRFVDGCRVLSDQVAGSPSPWLRYETGHCLTHVPCEFEDSAEAHATGVLPLELASRQGVVEAACALEELFLETGDGRPRAGLPVDERQGHALCMEGTENSDAHAQSIVGQNYLLGRGTAEDPAWAFVWSVAGAENGSGDAQFRDGRLFLAGETVRFDLERATEMLFATDVGDTRLYAGMIGESLSCSLPIIAENVGEHEVGPYASISLPWLEIPRQTKGYDVLPAEAVEATRELADQSIEPVNDPKTRQRALEEFLES